MISHLDAQIGRILKTLEETGHDRDTLVSRRPGDNVLSRWQRLNGGQHDGPLRAQSACAAVWPGPGSKGQSRGAVYLYDLFPDRVRT